jgi:hypothetical protein
MILMQDYQIRQIGLILAEFTRALGMAAENMQRNVYEHSMAYTEKEFYECANQIEFLANQLR